MKKIDSKTLESLALEKAWRTLLASHINPMYLLETILFSTEFDKFISIHMEFSRVVAS